MSTAPRYTYGSWCTDCDHPMTDHGATPRAYLEQRRPYLCRRPGCECAQPHDGPPWVPLDRKTFNNLMRLKGLAPL